MKISMNVLDAMLTLLKDFNINTRTTSVNVALIFLLFNLEDNSLRIQSIIIF